MRRRRATAAVAANPVLIGAATVLIAVVAVFLAYNANSGLPFVPSYQLTAEVPNAAQLVKGNDVRIGGARVGAVSEIEPKVYPSGRVTALLTLKLEKRVAPLPRDTTVLIRPRSALGIKYVQLHPGYSRHTFPDGATMPLASATPRPVELDEVLNTFDAPTRAAARENLGQLGSALAGRGGDLNQAIERLDPLLANLIPVARNLADPRTRLSGLVRALARTTGQLAPAADTLADLFTNLDTTFGALAGVAPELADAIAQAPPTLTTAIDSFRVQRPFLANASALFAELEPGARALGAAAPTLAHTLRVGPPVLRRSVDLSRRLEAALRALGRFSGDPLVSSGLRELTDTARTLNPTLSFVAPAQTVCNYGTLWFRNISSVLSDGGPNGTWQRFIIILTPNGPNNEGSPASAPANGPTLPPSPPSSNHLHANPYPNTAAPGQPRECEAGNEPYRVGRTVIGNPPGNQGTKTEKTRDEVGG